MVLSGYYQTTIANCRTIIEKMRVSLIKLMKFFVVYILVWNVKSVTCDYNYTCTIPAICKCGIERNATIQQGALAASSSFVVSDTPNICTLKPNASESSKYLQEKPPTIALTCSYIDITPNSSIPTGKADNESFYLTLKYPCSPPKPPDTSKGYGTGSILLIIFFTFIFAYLGLGMAVNFFILGARGIEIIPNLNFWRDLPNLVKDGAVFIQNGCKVPQSDHYSRSPESYDAI